jgi:hypothetical protein
MQDESSVDWPEANLGAIAATGFNYIHIDINNISLHEQFLDSFQVVSKGD